MRSRFIAIVVLVALSIALAVEAQRVKTYNYSGSETCRWGARHQQRGILMSYRGFFGRIAVRAPRVPAYSWVVFSNSGEQIAGGNATTPDEALNALCGKLIHIFGTGNVPRNLRPDDAYRQLLDTLEQRR